MPVLRIVPALLSFTAGFVDSCTFQRAAPLDHYHQRDRHQRDLLRQYRRQHIDRNVSRRHRGLVDHAQHDRRHLLHGGRDNAERDGCGDVLMRGFAGLLAAWLALSPAFAVVRMSPPPRPARQPPAKSPAPRPTIVRARVMSGGTYLRVSARVRLFRSPRLLRQISRPYL